MQTMDVESYLAQGGALTSPANAPPRYRGELLRWMASFVDSELAGSAGFADLINAAPGLIPRAWFVLAHHPPIARRYRSADRLTTALPSCSIWSSPSETWHTIGFIIGGPMVFDPG